MKNYQGYTIEINWSEDGIWGPDGTDCYYAEESIEKLAAKVRSAVEEAYPGAEVMIDLASIGDKVSVYSEGDDIATEDEIKHDVEALGAAVWRAFDWMVEAYAKRKVVDVYLTVTREQDRFSRATEFVVSAMNLRATVRSVHLSSDSVRIESADGREIPEAEHEYLLGIVRRVNEEIKRAGPPANTKSI